MFLQILYNLSLAYIPGNLEHRYRQQMWGMALGGFSSSLTLVIMTWYNNLLIPQFDTCPLDFPPHKYKESKEWGCVTMYESSMQDLDFDSRHMRGALWIDVSLCVFSVTAQDWKAVNRRVYLGRYSYGGLATVWTLNGCFGSMFIGDFIGMLWERAQWNLLAEQGPWGAWAVSGVVAYVRLKSPTGNLRALRWP